MAYNVASGALLEVSLKGQFQGQTIICVLHYRYNSTAGPADGRDVIDAVFTEHNNDVGNHLFVDYLRGLSQQFQLQEAVYQWIWPTRRARVVKNPSSTNGQVETDPAPPNVAVMIEKLSDLAGVHGHGAVHLGGLPASAYTGKDVNDAWKAQEDEFRLDLARTIPLEFGVEVAPVIFNRAVPADSVAVATAVFLPNVRTMHRRSVGVGI